MKEEKTTTVTIKYGHENSTTTPTTINYPVKNLNLPAVEKIFDNAIQKVKETQ